MRLELVRLVLGDLGEAEWRVLLVAADDLEMVVPKLNGERGQVRQEEHDQRPLSAGRMHVQPLSHQSEV